MQILIPALVLGGTGLILGLLIYVVGKYFHVEEDKRLERIIELLPRYNCGACGFPGCQGMAEALLTGKVKPAQCKPIKKEDKEILERHMSEILGQK
jgi:electron transport complex protein RnfB